MARSAGMLVDPVVLEWHDVSAVVYGKDQTKRKKRKGKSQDGGGQVGVGGVQSPASAKEAVSSAGCEDVPMKVILRRSSGCARPGSMTALMGPSGSGKTTLLSALAGQVTRSGSDLRLYGQVKMNGILCHSKSSRDGLSGANSAGGEKRIAFIRQDDQFFSELTVLETIEFAATLESGSNRDSQMDPETILSKIGLGTCMYQKVGGSKKGGGDDGGKGGSGCSGGERRRLSMALELLNSPSLIFCDEPTSGLDAYQAQRVVYTLRQLADNGHTVICSIHQPRASVFKLFDQLLLLSQGDTVYFGKASDALGHLLSVCHNDYSNKERGNPAEDIIDLISIDFSSQDMENQSRKLRDRLVESWRRIGSKVDGYNSYSIPNGNPRPNTTTDPTPGRSKGWLFQFRRLLWRSWKQVSRDKYTSVARIMTALSSSIIFGSIYWQLPRTRGGLISRKGLLQVASINTAMSSIVKTLNTFPRERSISKRERFRGLYSAGPYFAAKLVSEAPFSALPSLLFGSILYPASGLSASLKKFATFISVLTAESFAATSLGLFIGSISPSTEVALAVGPALMVVFIIFGGQYQDMSTLPRVWRPIPSISMIRWGFQGLCVNEFHDNMYDGKLDGNKELESLGFHGGSGKAIRALSMITGFNYLLTYYILRKEAQDTLLFDDPEKLSKHI